MSSRKNPQDYSVLNLNRFNEYCAVLGIKELSCYDPDKKAIERAFRKRALKTHPDKGGDPVEFKKINDAYNKLMGHIFKLEQQAEQNELAESILIEVSKTSIPKWIEKMKRSYGYPKSSDCKCIIFEGPYKQFKGRSKNTGPITVVLYEDPQDGVPKIHIRSRKYMAWIAEQMLPVHMHVDKGRSIQFDQWRIAHVAEFGIEAFKTPPTPAPERKPPPPAETKPKRKARDSSVPKPKTRRDSEPSPCPGDIPNNNNNKDKENQEPEKGERCEEFDENQEDENDPFPKVYNMADGTYSKTGKKMKKKKPKPKKPPPPEFVYNCGHCGAGFNSMLEFNHHKTKCIPDEDFGHYADYVNDKRKEEATKMDVDNSKSHENAENEKKVNGESAPEPAKPKPTTEKPFERPSDINPSIFNFLTGCTSAPTRKSPDQAAYTCSGCTSGYNSLKDYSQHKKGCATASPTSPAASPINIPDDIKDVKPDYMETDTVPKFSENGFKYTENVSKPSEDTSKLSEPKLEKKSKKQEDQSEKVENKVVEEAIPVKLQTAEPKLTCPEQSQAPDVVMQEEKVKSPKAKHPPTQETQKSTKETKTTGDSQINGKLPETNGSVPVKKEKTEFVEKVKESTAAADDQILKPSNEVEQKDVNGLADEETKINLGTSKDLPPMTSNGHSLAEDKNDTTDTNVASNLTSSAKSSNLSDVKKKDKIKLTSSSKVTKSLKPEPGQKKKIALEKEMIIESKNKEEIVKKKSKQEKEPDAEKQSGNIQMGSLKENLPAASKNSGCN